MAVAAGLVTLAGVAAIGRAATAQEVATPVQCGQVLTSSVSVANDLSECPGDGLVIGATGITVDLNGHTLDGTGLGAGVLNNGFGDVTITNGAVRDFDFGVLLGPGTGENDVSHLSAELAQEAGIMLLGADPGNVIRSNTFAENALALGLADGTEGAVVRDNAVGAGGGHGLEIIASRANTVERNTFAAASDGGVVLLGSSGNVL
jgi:large repetitive protein